MNKSIDELEEFLLADLPSKIFPMDRTLGRTMFREDFFKTSKDVEKYIKLHFKIFRRNNKIQEKGTKSNRKGLAVN